MFVAQVGPLHYGPARIALRFSVVKGNIKYCGQGPLKLQFNQLTLDLRGAYMRKRNLAKLDRLVKVMNEFSEAVHAEAKLIEKRYKD